ncbi:hypothetical protein Pcaca05_32670 [Pectobacterium carotovorum subsp. carotovorum]|nr:hypothetical protein Pcaca05_32670 [Pectobacterium carotovorum subsp. carotovorum]
MPIYEHCPSEQCSLLYPSYFTLHVRWLLLLTPVTYLSKLPGHAMRLLFSPVLERFPVTVFCISLAGQGE